MIKPPWYKTIVFKISAGSFLILILWVSIFYRLKTIRKKHEREKKLLEIEKRYFDLEQKALRLQMNPHFIFNTLNSIQSFVITSETEKAINYLAKFAKLMRLMLLNSRESFISIKDELEALTHYMDIERLRFDNKFDYNIEIGSDIDDEFLGIPPMILQPYVENAILHGIMHKKSRGNIDIKIKLLGDIIFCSIEDDGIGRNLAMKHKEKEGLGRKSKGMLITKERLEILNKQNKEKISVNVIDITDDLGKGKGTRVEITTLIKEI